MRFDELQKILDDNFSTEKLSDIAHELGVTPQVVSNWKSRNQVPYKYVKIVRKKIAELSKKPYKAQKSEQNFVSEGYISRGGDVNEGLETFLEYYKLIKNNYKILILGVLISLILSFLHNFFINEPNHIARARILPASDGSGNSIGGIATQFGLNLQGNEESSLVDSKLYPDIIKSRRLARKILRMEFLSSENSKPYPLVKILSNDFSDSTISLSEIKRYTGKLIQMISVELTPNKLLLDLEIGTTSPVLSKSLMEALITNLESLLNSFKNDEVSEKKKFIMKRILSVESDLILAEDELRVFREQNRKINFSPALLLEEERFIRDIDVQKQIFITLKSQLEMIQIDENSNKRMLQVLDPPEYFGNTALSFLQIALAYIVIGVAVSCFMVISLDWYKKNKLILID